MLRVRGWTKAQHWQIEEKNQKGYPWVSSVSGADKVIIAIKKKKNRKGC